MKPYDWQQKDIDRIVESGGVALLNMQPGAGKTVSAVFSARELDSKVNLIIAPLNTHEGAWGRTVKSILNEEVRQIGTANKAQRAALADLEWRQPGWYITTPQWFTRADISAWDLDLSIADEALTLDTPIPTPDGWTTMGALRPGDRVFGADGQPCKVVRTLPIQEAGDVYRLTFRDGSTIDADAGHKWVAAPQVHGGSQYLKSRVVSTREMYVRGSRWAIARTEPLDLPPATLPIDPYVLGQWLGNGSRKQPHLAVRSSLLETTIREFESRGYELVPLPKQQGRTDVVRCTIRSGFSKEMRALLPNTWSDKTPPISYTRGSIQQRLDFFRGLMDTDGHVYRGTYTFTNTNNDLISVVSELARSLGFGVGARGRVQDNEFTRKPCFRVLFGGSGVPIPMLLRDRHKHQERTTGAFHTVVKIEKIPSAPVRCIEVDSKDHLFLAGASMIPTHNCHLLGNAGSKGQRKLSGYDWQKDGDPLSVRSTHRLALSGTPARNNFERMWSVMRFLWPERSGSGDIADANYYRWLTRNMRSHRIFTGIDPRTRQPKYAREWTEEYTPGRLLSEAPCVIQHFRRERCCDFHPDGFLSNEEPNVVYRTVDLSSAQRGIIRDLENQSLAWLDEHPLSVELPITLYTRVKQTLLGVPTMVPTGEYDEDDLEIMKVTFDSECVSPFADETEHILEQLGEETAVVYVDSQQFAAALTERLNKRGIPAFEFSGKTREIRDDLLSRLGKDYRVCVATMSSFGTGTDGVQDVCNNEIWLEVPDNTTAQQTEARLDRLGQTKQVQRFYIQDSEGRVSGRMSEKIEERLTLAKSLRIQ